MYNFKKFPILKTVNQLQQDYIEVIPIILKIEMRFREL